MDNEGNEYRGVQQRRRWIKAVGGGFIVWFLMMSFLSLAANLVLPELDPEPGSPTFPLLTMLIGVILWLGPVLLGVWYGVRTFRAETW